MTKQTLGQHIAGKRRGRGMTQEALAEQLSVTPQAVSKWENDASCPDVLRVDTRNGTHMELWVD
ncbi:MAG: helix-turn-helix domain-containing protein [Aristaeellaceae bacterium]